MAAHADHRDEIAGALKALEGHPYADASRRFFATLGYKSDRRVQITTPRQFREQLDPHGRLTERECEDLEQLKSLNLLFQLSDAELAAHGDMFDDATALQA